MVIVRIAILSKDNQVLGFLDNDAPSALHFYNDTLHIYLTGTAHTFEFTCSEKHDDAQLLEVGNKLAFFYKNKPYYLNIMTTSHTETEITVEAWAYCLELLNETAKAYSATEAMSFEAYFKKMIYSNDVIAIGLNEVSDKKIKSEWTSTTDTLLKRLYSLADTFSAELEFVPVLNDDYTFSKIEVNVYKEHSDTNQGIGEKRTDANYRYGKGVDGITKKQDITSLYTAIRPTGEDDLTITGVEDRTVTDDDGNVLYFHKKGSGLIYAKQAMETFPSAVGTDDKYICYNWETDYSTTEALYGNALAKLKTISVPDSTYEIEGTIDVNIGDTITVIDESFNPALYLETRVTEQEISFTDSTKNKSTFENTKELESQIDDSLTKRVEELAKATASAAEKADSAVTKVETVTADVEAVKTTASEAKSAAATATETANQAATDAATAKSDASTASTKATEAASSASSAQASASAAQTQAETANTAAQASASSASTASAQATASAKSASEASAAANSSVVSSVTEYYLSTSATSQTGGSWSTTSPTWKEGTYVWTRTKTTTKGGTVSYSNAACVTGNTGAQGAQGIQGETGATGASFQWNMLATTNTSDLVFGGSSETGDFDSSEIEEDGVLIKRITGNTKTESSTAWHFGYIYDKGKTTLKALCLKVESNPTITISMDIRLNYDYTGTIKIGILNSNAAAFVYQMSETESIRFAADTWHHIALTLSAAEEPKYTDITVIYIYRTLLDTLKEAGHSLDIKNVKIEPGDRATEWCTTQAETIGKDGTSVSKTYTQYYLSTSNTTQTGGSWSDTMPTWSSGKYIWQREITVLSTGSTVTSTAVLSNGLNSANQTASTANSNASSAVSTANTANTNASNAVSTANTASSNASKAVTTANSASTAASEAKTTATNAQTTADTAKSTADTAQTTASEAKEIAEEVKGRHQIFAQDSEPTEATAGDIWFNTTEIQWDNVFYKPCTPYIKIKKSDGTEAFEQTAIARNYGADQSVENRDIVYVGHDQIFGGTESKYYGLSTGGISANGGDLGNYELTTDTLKSYSNELGGYWLNMYANGLRTKSEVPIDVPTVSADTSANNLQAVNLTYLKSYVTNAINSALTWKTLAQNESCGNSNKISFPSGTWHEIIVLAKYHASGASTGGYDYVETTIPYAQWKYANDNYGTGTQVILAGVVENPSDYVNNGHMSMSLRFAKSDTTWQLWVPRVYSHATNVTTAAYWDAYYR